MRPPGEVFVEGIADDAVAGIPGLEDEGAGTNRGAGIVRLQNLRHRNFTEDVAGDVVLVGGDGQERGRGLGERGFEGGSSTTGPR